MVAKSSDKSQAKITRIKASDDRPKKSSKVTAKKPAVVKKEVKAEVETEKAEKVNIFQRIIGYFKGSWQELTQVRWPDRATTWKMTIALILFTVFFVIVILLLDALFSYLTEILIRR